MEAQLREDQDKPLKHGGVVAMDKKACQKGGSGKKEVVQHRWGATCWGGGCGGVCTSVGSN